MDSCSLSLTAISIGSPLRLRVNFDNNTIFDQLVRDRTVISYEFDDSSDVKHLLELELVGKTASDTKINEQGDIIKDCLIKIEHVTLDGIKIDSVFKTNYSHDFNGDGPVTSEVFHGLMGCNGTVSFEFTSPGYMWLLENM